MESKRIGLKLFSMLLVSIIALPNLLKVATDFFLSFSLIKISSLQQLLPLSEISFLSNEFLFKLAIAFSDFNFNFFSFLNIISLLDIVPLLAIVLLLEINRITKKNRSLSRALKIILAIYIFKYIGLAVIISFVIYLGYQFVLGFNLLGYWLIIIAIAFTISIVYLIYVYNSF